MAEPTAHTIFQQTEQAMSNTSSNTFFQKHFIRLLLLPSGHLSLPVCLVYDKNAYKNMKAIETKATTNMTHEM